MSRTPPVQVLSYQPQHPTAHSQQHPMSTSASSNADSLDTRELPKIHSKQQQQQQQQQQPPKPNKKKNPKQTDQQRKSLSDSENRKNYRQQTTIEWRNPNQIDYTNPNRRHHDSDGINAPLLHRRLDAAFQRIDRIGSPKKVKKEIQELREQIARLEARTQDYQELKDSLTYQQSIVASVTARLAKMETDMQRLSRETAELGHLIRSPGALEDEQLRVTRERISQKRQQHTAGERTTSQLTASSTKQKP